jgi:hypothetical protein
VGFFSFGGAGERPVGGLKKGTSDVETFRGGGGINSGISPAVGGATSVVRGVAATFASSGVAFSDGRSGSEPSVVSGDTTAFAGGAAFFGGAATSVVFGGGGVFLFLVRVSR